MGEGRELGLRLIQKLPLCRPDGFVSADCIDLEQAVDQI
jgi:hypothetical protein